jgi:hypothetical protein
VVCSTNCVCGSPAQTTDEVEHFCAQHAGCFGGVSAQNGMCGSCTTPFWGGYSTKPHMWWFQHQTTYVVVLNSTSVLSMQAALGSSSAQNDMCDLHDTLLGWFQHQTTYVVVSNKPHLWLCLACSDRMSRNRRETWRCYCCCAAAR